MAEDKIRPAPPSGVSPSAPPDASLREANPALVRPPLGTAARFGIYLAVILVFAAIWLVVLHVFGYAGWKPAFVAVVLGVISFLSTRSFLVDRYVKVPVTVEATPQPTDTYREIVETVVFVVVLVLLLKSFVAEAFQIPTGSMAETLYGYQKMVKCPTCDYRFPVNCSDEVEDKKPVVRCTCPNCLQKIQFGSEIKADSTYALIANPEPSSGDRVLVGKFLYDLTGHWPDRLDVVVFKFPGESNMETRGGRPRFPESGPYLQGTQINYIKRLVGLPGEAIAIHRGKLYRLAPEQGLAFHDAAEANQLWRYKYMHECGLATGDAEDRQVYQPFWEQHRFEIIRKRPENILAMKRIVYDHDYVPRDQGATPGAPPRWTSDSWKADGKGFTVAPAAGQSAWLRYAHVLRTERPEDNPEPELITDFMGYNAGVSTLPGFPPAPPPLRGRNWVTDLILETEVEVHKAEGELVLELSKGIDRFQARWNLANGDCTLFRLRGVGDKQVRTRLESKPTALSRPGTYRLRFADVDERLTVWVGKDLPFGEGVVCVDPYRGGPVPANDLQPASIGSESAAVTARSIKLYRDTYYTANVDPQRLGGDIDSDHWGPSKTASEDRAWQQTLELLDEKNMPVLFLYVQPGHYLCLGDNSTHSSDGRSWGLVPNRLLLGRALLVYFPLNRLGRID